MSTIQHDPREITNLCERFVGVLPDLMRSLVAACEADPAFLALCREQNVIGGVGAAVESFHQAAEAVAEQD